MLITGDILCFVVSLYLTLLIRYVDIPSSELLQAHVSPFMMLGGVWIFIFYIAANSFLFSTFNFSLVIFSMRLIPPFFRRIIEPVYALEDLMTPETACQRTLGGPVTDWFSSRFERTRSPFARVKTVPSLPDTDLSRWAAC